MKTSVHARTAASGTHTLLTTLCVIFSGLYMLPAGVAALRNKRYLGTLFMLNIGTGFLVTVSYTTFAAAWLTLLLWSVLSDENTRRPLH